MFKIQINSKIAKNDLNRTKNNQNYFNLKKYRICFLIVFFLQNINLILTFIILKCKNLNSFIVFYFFYLLPFF